MASLYEIDTRIMACIDHETGELIDPEQLENLLMERNHKIENVSLWIKNLQADALAYKAEKEAFAERQKKAEAKVESLKNWLAKALNGASFTSTKCAVSFRKSTVCEIKDEERFIDFMLECGATQWIKFTEPTINKAAVKDALKSGQRIFGAELVERQNVIIK